MPIQIAWAAGAPPPDLDEATLHRALAAFLSVIDREGWDLSLLFADDAALQYLNNAYRGLNRPTDVLSWCYEDSEPHVRSDGGTPDRSLSGVETPMLGELALSLERAEQQARENGWARGTEVLRLLAHGCAHLAGHDHQTPVEEREMLGVEKAMLAAAGVSDLYPES